MKGIKALDKNMTCRGFKFEENKIYEEKEAVICKKGFHFCENPFDVLTYYSLCDSEFLEIEALGDIDKQKNGDSKRCTTKIKIGVKIGLDGFVKAAVNFLIDLCKKDNDYTGEFNKQAGSGDYCKQSSSGAYCQQASAGLSSQQASLGDYCKQACSGDYCKQASSGDYSQQAGSGDYCHQASAGYSCKQSSSGAYCQQASAGLSSQQASLGDYCNHILNGKNSVAAATGVNSTIKGKKGCWITLAEWERKDGKMVPVCVKSAKIDGKKIKEDVFYKLKGGKFIEVS